MAELFEINEVSPCPGGAVDANPLLDRIFRNRGISDPAELDLRLNNLLPFDSLKGIEDAVAVIAAGIGSNANFLVIGDYDCDGATATSVAVEGLQSLGAAHVQFLVPDRAIHGYGLTPGIVKLAGEYSPDIIITVDNGIASIEGAIEVGKLPGHPKLVITDHHLPASSGALPPADAIVNPNQAGCSFPSKHLAGVGVIFYVLLAVRAHFRSRGTYSETKEPLLSKLLDLVALGTVADLVKLDRNNRIMVLAGLRLIASGRARPGIYELLKTGGRNPETLRSSDLGFTVGPRINAAGRLDDMTVGIRCLLTHDAGEAHTLAVALHELNIQRRAIEADMTSDADVVLEEMETQWSAILYDAEWHEGVVGILASRVKEKKNRPVICFTDTAPLRRARTLSDPESLAELEVKGSGRSIAGFHLKHALDEIAKDFPDLLTKYGGHAMAAGVGLKLKNLQRFREAFERIAARELTPEMVDGSSVVDIKNVPVDWITLESAERIAQAGPWGQGFPEPRFSAVLHFRDSKVLKEKHLKLSVTIGGKAGAPCDAIAFNVIDASEDPLSGPVEAVFTLGVNEWKGRKKLQLVVERMQPLFVDTLSAKTPGVKLASTGPVIEGLTRKAPLARRREQQSNMRINP